MPLQIDLTPALQRAAKIIRARLLLQVPVDTGELKRSINVFVRNGEILIEFNEYGIYTNLGTGPYRVDVADRFEGYKKVKGGIFAQKWTAIPETDMNQIENLIDKEIDKALSKIDDIDDLIIEI